MASLPTPPSRSGAARPARRCSNASWTDVTDFADMDPEGFSLSDLAFEMEECSECSSSDTVFHEDGHLQPDDFPSRRRATDSPPPSLLADSHACPTRAEPASPKRKPAFPCYAPSTSTESPVDVTDDAWISNGAGSTSGMHCCSETLEMDQAQPALPCVHA